MTDETGGHDQRSAGEAERHWADSPGYISWMSGHIATRLAVGPGDRVVDIGCGDGRYSRPLAERAGAVVCVDASAAVLDELSRDVGHLPVHASLDDLVSGRARLPDSTYDAILCNQVVHHLPASDLVTTIGWPAGRLAPGGRLLIVTHPASIEYPLFEAALEEFQRRQPDPRDIAAALTAADLRAELSYETFPVSLPIRAYLDLVAGRFLAALATFDDDAIARGIAEIAARYPGPRLRFTDEMAFVLGTRP